MITFQSQLKGSADTKTIDLFLDWSCKLYDQYYVVTEK